MFSLIASNIVVTGIEVSSDVKWSLWANVGGVSVVYSLEKAQGETGRQKINLVLLLWETTIMASQSQRLI